MTFLKTYAEDLESDAFDPEEYVERLAWRLTGADKNPLNASNLHHAFEEEISNLQILSDQCISKITRLQNQCREEEEEYYVALERLQAENADGFDKLKALNERINAVAAKVVHLGDQLQSVNEPRCRTFDALQLMKHFNEFLADHPLESEIFTDPDRLLESAEVIHKLSLVAQELPVDKFSNVQSRINFKYDEIERLLIEEFVRMQQLNNKQAMKTLATILSLFKNYSLCIDAFIEHCQYQAFRTSDLFADILKLCVKIAPLVDEIFPNPQQVMSKLVLNIFHGKIQECVQARLSSSNGNVDSESYLVDLHDLYSKTQKLMADLSPLNISNDKDYLPTLCRSLFAKYLENYMTIEKAFLSSQCTSLLQKYYESKNHHKRNVQSTGLLDFKRDIQARFLPESFGGETFLSEELAINILQETKQAVQRCYSQSPPSQMPANVQIIFDILLTHLYQEHLDYALEINLYCIPLGDPKTEPETHFFKVVRQTAAISHLFEKQFDDVIFPLIKNTPQQDTCLENKKKALSNLEAKLSNGLDKLMNAIIGYVKFILTSEQKKTDFRPENDEATIVPLCSNACSQVVKYMSAQVDNVKDSLDGANLESVLTELGIRLHRTILEHIYQFSYSTQGAMLLVCDISEYRKLANSLKIPFLNKLYEIFQQLCTLLVVSADHLPSACTADLLGDVDRTIVSNFVQLRADYKTAKLYNLVSA
uniref:Exocyst complex component 5 n=1 Tax=Romanomermis culicivorax TaxID=13658 RepID=A0A915HR75_ROMCU